METMTPEQAVNEISRAFAELETAKEDCKAVVGATLDAYFQEIPSGAGKELTKQINDRRKTEAKNIKKLAKAMLKVEKEWAKEEAENMTDLIEALG